jgi:hypothetical protein
VAKKNFRRIFLFSILQVVCVVTPVILFKSRKKFLNCNHPFPLMVVFVEPPGAGLEMHEVSYAAI